MSGVYFKFLFATTIKKKPVWITWMLYVLTITMFIIVMPLAAGINPYQVWANTTMTVCQTFLGMAVAIFTAVLAINVFKEGNEEGTELIIISKPISRKKIVFTKFILYIVFCLMVNLCAVFISVFTIFIPGTEIEFYWGLVVSMFIGNLVCFSIFGSIAVLLSSQVAKVGVIITNIIISLVFLIYQILTLFVFKTPLKAASDDNVTPLNYVYAKRNTEDGSYVEKNYVDFRSSLDGNQFRIKGSKWEDVVDYWQGTIKSKDVSKILNITDLAGQVSLTYLSVGVNKYSERQANRMFAISRFWDYILTSPCSPEIINVEEHSTVKPENRDTIPFVYSGTRRYAYSYPGIIDFEFYTPKYYDVVGVRENKQSSLAGTFDNRVPVGWVRGDTLLSNRDIYLEQDKWNQYKNAFDAIYDTIYDYDLLDGNNQPYYDDSELLKQILAGKDDYASYSKLWAYTPSNLEKYYKLVWSMLTGHSSEMEYLGDHTPMDEELNQSLEINNNVDELNNRFIQYKYYAFYRLLADQKAMFERDYTTTAEQTAKNEVLTTNKLWSTYEDFPSGIMAELNSFPVEGTWLIEGKDNPSRVILFDLSFIQKGTKAPNIELMMQTKDQMIADGASIDDLKKCTFAQYLNFSDIFHKSVTLIENYLFVSTDAPTRKTKFTGEFYSDWLDWTPQIVNDLLVLSGEDPIPMGQNMTLFFYEANQTLDFWIYAVIWLAISFGLFGAGIVIYNKYDIK